MLGKTTRKRTRIGIEGARAHINNDKKNPRLEVRPRRKSYHPPIIIHRLLIELNPNQQQQRLPPTCGRSWIDSSGPTLEPAFGAGFVSPPSRIRSVPSAAMASAGSAFWDTCDHRALTPSAPSVTRPVPADPSNLLTTSTTWPMPTRACCGPLGWHPERTGRKSPP